MGTRPAELRDLHHGTNGPRSSLFAPLRYLRIQHPEKALYDAILPGVTTVFSWMLFRCCLPDIPIFGDSGLLRFERDFLVMAVPFLVGALAAVAMAGPGASLDRRPPGPDLTLSGRALTLRQFVCYLLGYLAFLGIFALASSVATELSHETEVKALVDHQSIKEGLFNVGTFFVFMLLNYIFITTLWALYFLTDVVNRP